jgi:hypothetical protein
LFIITVHLFYRGDAESRKGLGLINEIPASAIGMKTSLLKAGVLSLPGFNHGFPPRFRDSVVNGCMVLVLFWKIVPHWVRCGENVFSFVGGWILLSPETPVEPTLVQNKRQTLPADLTIARVGFPVLQCSLALKGRGLDSEEGRLSPTGIKGEGACLVCLRLRRKTTIPSPAMNEPQKQIGFYSWQPSPL